ncbi:MAG: DUF2141 domain-containing protein [Sphingomonas sp.]|uniref:DUF2141 domain-containing protein n=1 Tax=Sphingomonas sp. TaxID=28214 RepID=UPI001AD59E66|nr:DUF2141 domain-containing protein [Sphingomonas sp.]MBN8816203.1 DUF2141 domain-containing protein [Sphingomonas sp.]
MRFTLAALPLIVCGAFTATPLAAETIGEDAALCRAGRGPAVEVDVQGLKDRKGELWLELYPATAADYLAPDMDLVAAGKTFRRTRAIVPASGNVAICIRVPRPGRYALMLRHNRVGRDKFSFWSDGAGIPANRVLGRSKPTVDEATVTAGPGITTVNIKVQYLRGFGFAPLN